MSASASLQPILNELCCLSENRDLFFRLSGQPLPANPPPSSATRRENVERLKKIRVVLEKLCGAAEKEDTHKLLLNIGEEAKEEPFAYRSLLLGELVLLYTCLPKQDKGKQEALLDEIVRWFQSLGSTRASREWMTVMILYLESQQKESEYLNVLCTLNDKRAYLTGGPYSTRPGLVGEAFVGLGISAERKGDTARAIECYNGVFCDLDYADQRQHMPADLRWELTAIYYWFEQACLGLLRLRENAAARSKLQQVQSFRRGNNEPDAPSIPQIGPIAETYLTPKAHLARLLGEMRGSGGDDVSLFDVAHRYDYCKEIDFYQTAMGSYYSARPMLQGMGVKTTYDKSFQAVFEALDYSKEQNE